MIRLLIFVLVLLVLSGCFKDEAVKSLIMQDASFGITLVDPDGMKDDPWNFGCPTDDDGKLLIPTHALVEIVDTNGNVLSFNPQVFLLNGQLYTQAIKLQPGIYNIITFLLIAGNGGAVIMATPTVAGIFSEYVNNPLAFDFEVSAFAKSQVEIEVLCFRAELVGEFGFFWFDATEIVIRQFRFMGTICANGGATVQGETAYGGNYEGSGSPWWFYFDVAGPSTQTIYAGQQATDGTVTYAGGQIIIDLGSSLVLQEGDEPVKIHGFNELPASPVPLGPYHYKGTQLIWDVAAYPYYIIHLDVSATVPASAEAPFAPSDFEGSDYENVTGGLQTDMPAIFKVHVYRNFDGQLIEMPHSPFSNLGNEDEPLSVKYPDRIRVNGENFTFELHILVPDGEGDFVYLHYYTFTSTDDGALSIDPGANKILEFVLGNCGDPSFDLEIGW